MSEHDIHCEKENSPFQELYCYCEERAIVVKTAELKAENKTLRERVRELENPNPLVEIRVSPSEVYDPNGEAWKQRAINLLMSRGRKDAQIAVYLSALAIEARQGRKEWAQDIIKRADAAALKVKRKDLVVAHTNSQQEKDDE